MNQTKRSKRNNETLHIYQKSDYQSTFLPRRNSRTPELRNNTPTNTLKRKKTTSKINNNQKVEKNIEITRKDESQKRINNIFNQQQTLCETGQINIADIKYEQCENYQKRQKQMDEKLKSYQRNELEFEGKLQNLKQEYQKKLKKYKMKSRIQKDQLKLLKWILSQRKEFHQILQKLQKMKQKGIRPMDQELNKQNLMEYDVCSTDRTQPKQSLKQKIKVEQKMKPQVINKTQINTLPIQASQNIIEPQKTKVPTQREVQMFNHIDFLQQKVMELTIRNYFLEKLKLKENEETKLKSCSNEPISFTRDLMSHNNVIKYDSSRLQKGQDYEKECYQYSDDDQNFERQSNKAQSSYSPLLNSLQRNNLQVESRYISPLKQRINESHKKQKLNEFNKKEQKNHDSVPQSRSKYYDSIKQRSRLLGI